MNDGIPLFKQELIDWTGAVLSNLMRLGQSDNPQFFHLLVILAMARYAANSLKPDRAEDLISYLPEDLPATLEKERGEIVARIRYVRAIFDRDPSGIAPPSSDLAPLKEKGQSRSSLEEAFETFMQDVVHDIGDTQKQMLHDLFNRPPCPCNNGITAFLKAVLEGHLKEAYDIDLDHDKYPHAKQAVLAQLHKMAGNNFESAVLSVHQLIDITRKVFPEIAQEENPFEELEFVLPFINPDADLGNNFGNILDYEKLLSVWLRLEKHPLLKIPALGVKAALYPNREIQEQARKEIKRWLSSLDERDHQTILQDINNEYGHGQEQLWDRLVASLGQPEEAIVDKIKVIKGVPAIEELFERLKREFSKINEEFMDSSPEINSVKEHDASAWNNLGVSLHKTGRYTEAFACYIKALSIQPDLAKTWHNLGVSLGKSGRYMEAISCYIKALSIQPNDVLAWYNLGYSLYETGRYTEAFACYIKALSIQPDLAKTWHNLGYSLHKTGHINGAIFAA